MDILNRKFGILGFGIACLVITLQAVAMQKQHKTGAQNVASLLASPGVCEIPDDAVSCEMSVSFIWEMPQVESVCLWDSYHAKPLQCWHDAMTSTWQITFRGGQDREFFLKSHSSDEVYARTSIKVMGAIEQRLRARRRQGFWRIF
ncbi:DUF3019 domain-containing protein [Alteromonas sediminis]|uniref:DUF3019 domain-containing protein n=1 Tax=Alteromonas sediminis TaxID=2259342 RepID=A0A3N5XYK7_9ALTE|nr:DUF3019 domain-containing protein [Alteromonas sediminis]RPJ65680.1 DUF3019 domain-containing protein [Alteromonas sediminis]